MSTIVAVRPTEPCTLITGIAVPSVELARQPVEVLGRAEDVGLDSGSVEGELDQPVEVRRHHGAQATPVRASAATAAWPSFHVSMSSGSKSAK